MLNAQLLELGPLCYAGLALMQFAESQFPANQFRANGKRWVARPHNFVTFEVRSKRAKSIALSLRGYPTEFTDHPELPLKSGMAGYSECTVTHVRQLHAACAYVARAAELYRRGSSRTRRKPMVVE